MCCATNETGEKRNKEKDRTTKPGNYQNLREKTTTN